MPMLKPRFRPGEERNDGLTPVYTAVPTQSARIYPRDDANKALTRDQIIAIVGIFASFFGASCVYFLFTLTRKWWQRRLQRKAALEALEAGIHSASYTEPPVNSPGGGGGGTIINNYHLNYYSQHPPPTTQTDATFPFLPERAWGLGSPRSPTRVSTWPGHES